MATRRGAAVRRRLEELAAAAQGEGRYVDLLLHLRSVRADFPDPVPLGHEFVAGGIEFVTAAAGQVAVPVRSLTQQESAQVPDRTPIETGGELRGEVLLAAGGRWDLLHRTWASDGTPAAPHVLDLVESQHEITRVFASWLQRYKARRARPPAGEVLDLLNLLAYGNRGSGKTWICMLLVAAAMLEIPDSVGWFVVENRPASQEDVRQTFKELLPPAWTTWHDKPMYCWRFVHGSRLYEKSANEPAKLKQGRVDVVLLNEAAKMPSEVYGYATARTKDRGGGITLLASNPPTLDKPRGAWVFHLYELWREARAKGEWCEVETFRLESAHNAVIDRGADKGLKRLLRAIAPQLASADADGVMSMPGQRIVYAFDTIRHGLRAAPELGDLTAEFLRKHPRVGRPYRYLAGVDFQASFPHIVCVFFRIYGDLAKPMLWAVSDKMVKGNEDDFLDEVLHEGVVTGEGQAEEIERDTVLWIGDSSAQQQNSKHDFSAPPSFPAFLNRNLRILSPTSPVTKDAKYGRNPSVGVSLGQVNHFFKEDRILVSPLAPHLIEDCRDAIAKETDRGLRPDKPHSHFLDCLRYVAWFIEPPTKRRKPVSQQGGGGGAFAVPGF